MPVAPPVTTLTRPRRSKSCWTVAISENHRNRRCTPMNADQSQNRIQPVPKNAARNTLAHMSNAFSASIGVHRRFLFLWLYERIAGLDTLALLEHEQRID